ncbi:MAG: hypothetical protein PF637_03465 [Spirochaetes bacterium]|jgi:hypothetical protein|nr:hypothetical protein [Spirochaetota bacterium]
MFLTIFKLVLFFIFVLLFLNGLRLIVFVYKLLTGKISPSSTGKTKKNSRSKTIELDKDQYHVD